jgi:hypothetical protein
MRSIITICAAFLINVSVWAQSPEKMSYQAVVRDGSNKLVSSARVGLQISILQGSASGTAVYVETQTPTSNANGLVSLEIGSGTVVSGTFATIDWANGPYFIKTETDPTGGTTYTITGTSQLLSVPYALHAKTAESVTGKITETDPIFGASVANRITRTDTVNWNNKQDVLVAGTNITITGKTISVTGATALTIGQHYQGGIVFWLDATGQHGLIAATSDQSTGIQWNNTTERYTGASGDGLYAGAMNTVIAVATQIADNQTGNFAAKVCADYSVSDGGVTYGDWYLPSQYELNLLYAQQVSVGGFASAFYWSSTEYSNYINVLAWMQSFIDGFPSAGNKSGVNRVRAVRAF